MTIDTTPKQYIRLYRQEPGPFRALPITTKALAAYIRILVDPSHGLLYLRDAAVASAIRHHCAGEVTRADLRMLARCAPQLVEHGYLVRCRVVETTIDPFATRDGRELAVSPWLEDPKGDWLVIPDWLPEQHGLERDETLAWHQARRERISALNTGQKPEILETA